MEQTVQLNAWQRMTTVRSHDQNQDDKPQMHLTTRQNVKSLNNAYDGGVA